MATLAELQSRLTSVNAAIERTERAQGYTAGDGRSKQNPILDTLYKRQDKLEVQIDQLDSGGITVQGITTL